MVNQTHEQVARDKIDMQLTAAGWIVQSKNKINLAANIGVAVREYQTDVGPADYVLFVDRKPVGFIEAKGEDEGHKLTVVEEQSKGYADAKLKYLDNDPLPFVYESTGAEIRFTDYRDPKPTGRNTFSFHKPATMAEWLRKDKSLRSRLSDIPVLNPLVLRPAHIRAIENLEVSFKRNRPKALIQMATGAGKTFTTSYIENKGNDIFAVSPIENMAQLSSVKSSIAEDIKKDGNPDLLLAGNTIYTEVEIPKVDGSYGLVMLGDGKGAFSSIHPAKSNFYIVGEIPDMSSIKIGMDQFSEILTITNDGELNIS